MYLKILSALLLVLSIASCGACKSRECRAAFNDVNRVYFDLDSAELSRRAEKHLKAQVEQLKETKAKIKVEGHADERGTRAYNKELGARRAESVKTFLVEQGIEASRIKIVSYGEDQPAALGHDEQSWSQNRRTVTISTK